ncbi:MAG TPA: chromosomal replication initiator protein DnaA [Solirubrobacteraceae bacterium]
MELPENLELDDVWRAVSDELRVAVGESTYEIWIAPLEVSELDAGVLILRATPAIQAWVAKRFGQMLERTARAVTGLELRVAIEGASSSERPGSPRPEAAREELNPRYSFDQFIIGTGNRLAHAAALAVAELPGQAYNPLFLHAPPGLGKTHLLHAIGNYVRAFGGTTNVRYTTVEAFTNHFIKALGSRSLDAFKQTYRGVDVLLIDDVQFLASKARTEEEFFHTFNALYESGRQLVLTCDRLPRALDSVEERLRERFESGLVADIAAPDHSTRVAILRKRALLDRVPLSDPRVLDAIADRVTDNVRALEGALIRVVAYHSLTGQPIDLGLTMTVLDAMYPQRARTGTSIGEIQAAVASRYGLAVSDLLSPSRAARVTWPRQLAIYLAREFTETSLQTIGDAFGGRNHATVLHACKRVSDRLSNDQQLCRELGELKATVAETRPDRSY